MWKSSSMLVFAKLAMPETIKDDTNHRISLCDFNFSNTVGYPFHVIDTLIIFETTINIICKLIIQEAPTVDSATGVKV